MNSQKIRIGKMTLLLDGGFVRYIKIGNTEILRSVYFALRDSNWSTIPFEIKDFRIDSSDDRFDVSYSADGVLNGKKIYHWDVSIHGTSDGSLSMKVDGTALSEFIRNRVGICVLHPILETAGKLVEIEHESGLQSTTTFPVLVQPHQPLLDISKLRWSPASNIHCELSFYGDVFEAEDQRNWGDCSFKTYSTPLSRPYPVQLKPGDKISQEIHLKVTGSGESRGTSDTIIIERQQKRVAFPEFGFSYASQPWTSEDARLLSELRPDHLRLKIDVAESGWRNKLLTGLQKAEILSTTLFLVFVCGRDFEQDWISLQQELEKYANVNLSRIAVVPNDRKADVGWLVGKLVSQIITRYPRVKLGAGFLSYFVDLNRNRFDYDDLDFVTYSMNPQVHAIDSLTIIENLPAQPYVIETGKTFTGHKEVCVGPISLKPSFNPDAKSAEASEIHKLPAHVDERQSTTFAASWMVGVIKFLAEGNADVITLFDDCGMGGYFISKEGIVHSEFHYDKKIFPVYEVMRRIRQFMPTEVVVTKSSDELSCNALLLKRDSAELLVVPNHTLAKLHVKFGERQIELESFEVKFIEL